MDVRDRSNYASSLGSSAAEPTSRVRTDGPVSSSANGVSARSAGVGDSSALSPAARAAVQTLELPEVRHDRVSALQQQIASGNYNVASQDVADALVRTLRSWKGSVDA